MFAAAHLEAKGLDEGDANRLAAAFSKMGIQDASAIDVSAVAVGLSPCLDRRQRAPCAP